MLFRSLRLEASAVLLRRCEILIRECGGEGRGSAQRLGFSSEKTGVRGVTVINIQAKFGREAVLCACVSACVGN